MFNGVVNNKEEILEGYYEIIKELTDTKELDDKKARLEEESKELVEQINKCVHENAYTAQNQEEYKKRYNVLVERYESIKKSIVDIEEKRFERLVRREKIEEFIKVLKNTDELLDDFDEELWNVVLEEVKVIRENKVTFVFRDGMEIDWEV